MREPTTQRVIISCEKRQHLGEQFAIAARLYSEAVVALTRNHIPMSWTDYERLCDVVEEARQRVEAMREAYKQHVGSHQCITDRGGEAWGREE